MLVRGVRLCWQCVDRGCRIKKSGAVISEGILIVDRVSCLFMSYLLFSKQNSEGRDLSLAWRLSMPAR